VGAPGGVGPANRSKAPVQAGGSSSEREEPAQRTWLVRSPVQGRGRTASERVGALLDHPA